MKEKIIKKIHKVFKSLPKAAQENNKHLLNGIRNKNILELNALLEELIKKEHGEKISYSSGF